MTTGTSNQQPTDENTTNRSAPAVGTETGRQDSPEDAAAKAKLEAEAKAKREAADADAKAQLRVTEILGLADDTPPDSRRTEAEASAATAEALKPVSAAMSDWVPLPREQDKKLVLNARDEAYRKEVASNPNGPLRVTYTVARDKLRSTATDLMRKGVGEDKSRLERWIDEQFTQKKSSSLYTLFVEQKNLVTRLDPRRGMRERAREQTRAATARWADAFKAWSDPIPAITAEIGTTADTIDTLLADINLDRDADYAIYRFWFEVAPHLLQLNPDTTDDPPAAPLLPGLTELRTALAEFPEQRSKLLSAKGRGDGSVYIISADELPKQREAVLKSWTEAATAQGKAEADFLLRPDDTAALQTRLDGARTGEAEAAKALLSRAVTP